jgi:rare lipoprotein A
VVTSGACGASYYDEGQATANGEQFNPEALTAAHKTFAFNTRVRVTNPGNGKSVVVRINDRGPFVSGRCLDLSRAAFRTIASLGMGELTVKYEVLGA